MTVKHCPRLDIDVLECEHNGIVWRAPKLLGRRYELDSVLAAGGYGVIYSGRDLRLAEKPVLIKTSRYEPHLFGHPRDMALAPAVREQRERLGL